MSESSYTQGLPEELDLEVGDQVSLPLRGAMGSGYTWTVSVEGAGVRAAIVLTSPPQGPAGGPPRPSSFAAVGLELHASSPGPARVALRLARSWQPDSPLARHDLRVRVAGEPLQPLNRKESDHD